MNLSIAVSAATRVRKSLICVSALLSVGLSLASIAGTPPRNLDAPPRERIGRGNDCDSSAFATTLWPGAASAPANARAYWLSKQLIRWPATEATGTFKLYYSGTAQIATPTGGVVTGAEGFIALQSVGQQLPQPVALRFLYVAPGSNFAVADPDLPRLTELHKKQIVLVRETAGGIVQDATLLQIAGAMDEIYAPARDAVLGLNITASTTGFKLWAPTAQRVAVCVYSSGAGAMLEQQNLIADNVTGVWSQTFTGDLSGRYYTYLVDVFVPGVGIVRNRVTDPYSISLTTDSKRSYIANLNAENLKPTGWNTPPIAARAKVAAQTDMSIYELHVRDFSANDGTVSQAYRGKYMAFTEPNSSGMKHLKGLSDAGLTDIHFLPVFDIATIPEKNCISPLIPQAAADSEAQQDAVAATSGVDCFNWGYDPQHFNAPEGSYATDAADGATRIIEFRRMVQGLNAIGLRVGMDVVFNHTSSSSQFERSVLDRIVPGYYHRLNGEGKVENSSCCENTASENMMMGKLSVDSVVMWATQYNIDSFRYDLMAHMPRSVLEESQAKLNAATGRKINLIGEGWNFGEVANNRRFLQASQIGLNGSGIGSFNDRLRDAVRGGGCCDSGDNLMRNQGFINGLVYDLNALSVNSNRPMSDLMRAADIVRVALAGSVRDYTMQTYTNSNVALQAIDYGGQPAGYVVEPSEVVNYADNHDNHTLFDINAFKLPFSTTRDDRVRAQMLGAAVVIFAQGVPYFHAGIDILRSKSLDANSYDSGDWFNRIDWSYNDNYYGSGAPPKRDNSGAYGLIKSLLVRPEIKPTSLEINLAKDMFRDLLKIRASTSLLRLKTAADIKSRFKLYNTGSSQIATVVSGYVDGANYAGANFKEIIYFINVDKAAQNINVPTERGKTYVLHPVHQDATAADKRPATLGTFDTATGRFTVPAKTAMVWVVK